MAWGLRQIQLRTNLYLEKFGTVNAAKNSHVSDISSHVALCVSSAHEGDCSVVQMRPYMTRLFKIITGYHWIIINIADATYLSSKDEYALNFQVIELVYITYNNKHRCYIRRNPCYPETWSMLKTTKNQQCWFSVQKQFLNCEQTWEVGRI
jgi:hypothetical protein